MRRLEKQRVRDVIDALDGPFTNRDLWQEIDIVTGEGKAALRAILHEFKEAGLITSDGGGHWRKKAEAAEELDWQNTDPNRHVHIDFPFPDIGNLVKFFPKAVIVIAGSSNSGKTAMCYNLVALNMDKYKVDLYNNETSPEQMKERFGPLMIPTPAPFKVYQRYDRFQDVIDPDHLSVIDYLTVDSEFYMIEAEISAIWKRLNNGIAVVALQKPPGRDDAFGGSMIRNRASLYLTLDKDKLKILKAKAWKDPYRNPNGMMWSFKLEHGIFFQDIKPVIDPFEGMK